MSTRRFLQGFLLLSGFTISACTAILVPNEDGDGVVRCNTTADCPDISDNRYVSACVFGEGQPENSDKVCSSDYEEVECGDTFYDVNHVLTQKYAEAQDNKVAYSSCSDEDKGTLGCDAVGSCASGLEVNRFETCDEPDADIPAVSPAKIGLSEVAGRDVQDQFCRSYFCDERFVCDTSLSKPVCVVCNDEDPFGEGGCGTLYIQGVKSSVYADLEGTGNCSGNTATADITIGDVPVPMLP